MLLHSTLLLALVSLGASKRFGYLKAPRPVSNSSDLHQRASGCTESGSVQIDCDGVCIPYNYDCCRVGDGSYCEVACDTLGGGCSDSIGGGSGGGYGGGDDSYGGSGGSGGETFECEDDWSVCDSICIPPTGMCCGDGTWCKAGKCMPDMTCDTGDDKTKEQGSSSGKGTDEKETGGSGSGSSGKGNDSDESDSKEKESSDDSKSGDDKDSDKDSDKDTDEKSSESKEEDKGNDASLSLPTLVVGLVALAPLLL
ncbi:hypothetical protein ACHAPT_010880 [Fusarium lateritium]